MPSDRVHIVMAAEERAAYKAAARREGLTLSEWLRQAARDRLRATEPVGPSTADELEAFFAARDEAEGDAREPDWGEHLAVMTESRRRGLPT